MTANPLNELLTKGAPEKSYPTDSQLNSLRKFIDAVCCPPVLALSKRYLTYSVHAYVSEYGLGCALFETYDDGDRKPIAHWSQSLKPV